MITITLSRVILDMFVQIDFFHAFFNHVFFSIKKKNNFKIPWFSNVRFYAKHFSIALLLMCVTLNCSILEGMAAHLFNADFVRFSVCFNVCFEWEFDAFFFYIS